MRRQILTGLLALLWAGIAHASVPNVLHFSGALKSEGAAFTGTMAMTFALYDGPEANEALWTETQSVAVQANRFQILLGINVSFDTTTFDAAALHLGITVESEDEMTPRMRLASVPYAMRAAGLTCTGCVGKAQLEAGLLAPVATTGDYNDLTNKPDLSAMLTGPGSAGALAKYTAAATLADSVIHDVNGQVGVGTTSPQVRFDVDGAIRIGNHLGKCTTDKAGAIRWTGARFEGCNGLTWVPLSSLSAACAAIDTTCDGNDDDCDGNIDEDYVSEATSCGTGVCTATGTTSCSTGSVSDSCAPTAPPTGYDAACSLVSCPANATGEPNCVCKPGYSGTPTWNGASWDGTCTDVDECGLGTDNCSDYAVCLNTAGSFVCTCNPGFSGDGVSCADVNECALGTDNCSGNAICVNVSGSFLCSCNPGYAGDGVSCADVNECALGTDNCSGNAICLNTAGSYVCSCNPGYSGDGVTCTENPCGYGWAGIGTNNGWTCVDVCAASGRLTVDWDDLAEQQAYCHLLHPNAVEFVADPSSFSYPIWEPQNNRCKLNANGAKGQNFAGNGTTAYGDQILCKCCPG